jgi:hypothetical protein
MRAAAVRTVYIVKKYVMSRFERKQSAGDTPNQLIRLL